MEKKIKNVFSVFLGTILNIVLGFITVPIITHIIEPTSYGKFSVIQTYISIFVSVCLLGLDQAYVRFYYNDISVEYKRELTHKVIQVPLLISLLCSVLVISCGSFVIEADIIIFSLVCVCIIATIMESFTRLCLRLEQQGSLYSFFLVLHRLSYAMIVIGLVCFSPIEPVKSLLIGTAVSLLINVVVTIIVKSDIWGIYRKKEKHIQMLELIRYAYPFVFSSIAGWIFNAADKLTLQYFSTYEEIGFYSAAVNIVSLITIIQTTFTTLWVPMAVEKFENDHNDKRFYKESNDIIVVIMFVAGFTIVLMKDLFAQILGSEYIIASQIFPCLVLQPMMFAISETTVYGINFYKKTKWHIIITSTCCIINVVGNILLVPHLSGKGAAISTGISYIVFFVLRTVISNRYYKVDFSYKKITASVVMAVIFFVYQTFVETNYISVLLYIIFVSAFAILYFSTIRKYSSLLIINLKRRRNG